jgi:hypothetical protein
MIRIAVLSWLALLTTIAPIAHADDTEMHVVEIGRGSAHLEDSSPGPSPEGVRHFEMLGDFSSWKKPVQAWTSDGRCFEITEFVDCCAVGMFSPSDHKAYGDTGTSIACRQGLHAQQLRSYDFEYRCVEKDGSSYSGISCMRGVQPPDAADLGFHVRRTDGPNTSCADVDYADDKASQ